jgi:phage terminase small subunit
MESGYKRTPTDRALMFAAEYVKDLNGTQAAKRAGYTGVHVEREAQRLLADPVVRGIIDARLQERFERSEALLRAKAAEADITAERVLEELARVAFADIGQCFDAEGKLLPIKQIPEFMRRAIGGFDVVKRKNHARDGDTDEVEKVRLIDKSRALELLSRYFGMLVERKEVGKPGEFKRLSDTELEEKTRALLAKALKPDPTSAVH